VKCVELTLKMEAICSTETSVTTQQTTRRHIPEYVTLQILQMFKLLNGFLRASVTCVRSTLFEF
jgi:hypothetical protein